MIDFKNDDSEPDLGPEPGWVELNTRPRKSGGSRFLTGDGRSDRLRIHYYKSPDNLRLFGKIWFGPESEGPPNHAHGGSQAAALDEAMGASAWLAGQISVAAKISVNFRNMLPLGSVVRVEAHVTGVEGRRVYTKGALTGPDGTVYSDGEGIFIRIGKEKIEELAALAHSEDWGPGSV